MLLVHSDAAVRDSLASVFRSAGVSLVTAGSIAEVERWPHGELLMVEQQFFTPFWLTVGAAHVIVVTGAAEQHAGNHSGAVTFVPLHAGPEALLAAVDSFRLAAA